MPISSFARLGASVLTLAFGLTLAGENPAFAGPKPAQSSTALKAVDSAKTGASRTKIAKRSRTVKANTVKTKPAPVATGSLAKEAAETTSTEAPGVTWTSAEPDELRCGRSRRKLWQAGEGWVVKNVTVCR
ncbi:MULTISPECIES: hypothetical protein [unclassified Methylobacterium]|uniref:hypothetical protein n=1 Tax=unclassified Methylobacterium TaxID=2615210 RepID=UPI000A948C46|nr:MULTISPECIES: hypothetical protein [unclassified Methylobacterium]